MKALDDSFHSVWEKCRALTEGSVDEMIISQIIEDMWDLVDVAVGSDHIRDDIREGV